MYFSISAPQNVTLPDGRVLSFRVNPVDTSLVELHVLGTNQNDETGTHVLSFKRNGSMADQSFVALPKPDAPYPSVDKDAVRGDNWRNPATKSAGSADAKPLGGEKVDPVHGKITTAGTDAQAGKPREARPEDASNADRAERAGVGMPPQATPDRGYSTPVDDKPAA